MKSVSIIKKLWCGNTWYECSNCNNEVKKSSDFSSDRDSYCSKCGCELNWNDIKYANSIPGDIFGS